MPSDKCLQTNAPSNSPSISTTLSSSSSHTSESPSFKPSPSPVVRLPLLPTKSPMSPTTMMPTSSSSRRATLKPTSSPSETEPSLSPVTTPIEKPYWYPHLWTRHCVFGTGPSWMSLRWNAPKYLFESVEECCEKHGCEIKAPTNAPSVAPSAATTKSGYWYPDLYNEGVQCVLGSGYDWMTLWWNASNYLFESRYACCKQHGCLFSAESNDIGWKCLPLYVACVLMMLCAFWIH